MRQTRLLVDETPEQWMLSASEAREGALARGQFRAYLERNGDPASDLDAAACVYGELVNSCVQHAPGPIRIIFRWEDSSLVVLDSCDRLRSWPFSPDDMHAEETHHAHRVINALGRHLHVSRAEGGGTRARVVLPVLRAAHVSAPA